MKKPTELPAINHPSRPFDMHRMAQRLRQHGSQLFVPVKAFDLPSRMEALSQRSQQFLEEIKSLGLTKTMDELEKGKLSVFNQLNFFQFIAGLLVPLVCLLQNHPFSLGSFIIACLPAMVNLVALYLNFSILSEAGMFAYFIFYPLIASIVYMNGLNLGVELFFILNGILAVFFLPQISQMLFSVGLSMISYFMLVAMHSSYPFQLQTQNFYLYLFNQITAIVFIFYALFLIKKESNVYQFGILASNRALQENNTKIERQKKEIEQKAAELEELNLFKNKLLSIISHDMKTPMYALRNLFGSMQQPDFSGDEIKAMIPDVVTELNYTTGLIENLLQWVKSQMDSGSVSTILLDMNAITEEVINVQHLQARSKLISISREIASAAYVMGDRDMVTLVLRNLLSNAIKFTPERGRICVGAVAEGKNYRISVTDNGIGMDSATIDRINEQNYYSTNGTAQENGTGLGLMLCKDFLQKNGGSLSISSTPGKGSTFSFTLPVALM